MPFLKNFEAVGSVLDTCKTAFCLFDHEDRTLLWNKTFLAFFPEHDGHVKKGEHYRENLHRFYSSRLPAYELPNIERYVSDGIARHRAQTRPFVFSHRGRRLRVSAGPIPGGGRVRIWQEIGRVQGDAAPSPRADLLLDFLEYIPDGATVVDAEGKLVAANNEFRILYDVPPGRSIVGVSLAEITQQAWMSANEANPAVEMGFLDNLRFVGAPFEVELPGGRWCRVVARMSDGGMSYFIHTDITPLRRALAELAAVATTDSLTGLLNRRRFQELLIQECRRASRLQMPLALMLIDVDRFKSVNDGYGHPTGDECLARIARIMNASIRRPGDVAARLGGDEFAVLLPNTDAAGARFIAAAIASAVAAEPWHELHPDLRHIGISIGVCAATHLTPRCHRELTRHADAMLYEVKRSGRGGIRVTEMQSGAPVDRAGT